MKKICHMTSAHYRHDNRILKRECVSLAENGYNVSLVVNDEKSNEMYGKVNIVSTGISNRVNRIKRMSKGVYAVYRKGIALNADIYHLHDPELLLIAMKLKRLGKRVIFDSHEIYAVQIMNKEYIPKPLRKIIAHIYYKYESYVSKRIDGVIIPSSIEKSGVSNKYSFVGRCSVVGYVNNYPRQEEINFTERDYSNVKRSICYVGSLSYERGIEQLVKVAKRTDLKFLFAGNFSSKVFKEKILGLADSKKIIYEGYLESEDLKEVYSKSDIGMCTLLPIGQYDKLSNLPTKVYEYMGMGMPVIISDFTYNRKFIKKYPIGYLVNPENIEDIVCKINKILNHPEEAEEMGKIGRKIFIEKYNWSIAEKELLKVYKKILV